MTGTTTHRPTATSHRAAPATSAPAKPKGGTWSPGGAPGDHHLHLHAPRRTTPNILRALGAAAVVTAFIVAIPVASFAGSAHSQVASVKNTDGPSATAMSDFVFQVEDMDAQLANALLINGDTSLATSRASSVAGYETDRQNADQDLQLATTATSGDAEAQAELKTVLDRFGKYEELASQALQLDMQAGVAKAGATPDNVVSAYRTASEAMSGQDGLAVAGKKLAISAGMHLGDVGTAAQGSISGGANLSAFLGILLLGVLGVVQVVLYRRFQRIVNPGLAAATAVALLLVITGYGAFSGSGDQLRNATSNAFTSIQSLKLAKAESYDANADESRWLLDRANTDQHTQDFYDKSFRIAGFATNQPQGYSDSLAKDFHSLTPDTMSATLLTTDSDLGKEFSNITFPGEGQAAYDMYQAYVTYQADDTRMRQTDISTPSGLLKDIGLDTDSKNAGSSDFDFNVYSQKLDAVVALNQAQFDSSTSAAMSGVSAWSWLPYLYALLITALVVAGLRPRLNEFR